jgi:integrase
VSSYGHTDVGGWTCWQCGAWVPDGVTHFYLHPHTTRHTYGWRLRGEGWDLEERAEAMGHEDPSTTKKYYGRLTADDLMDKIAAVEW